MQHHFSSMSVSNQWTNQKNSREGQRCKLLITVLINVNVNRRWRHCEFLFIGAHSCCVYPRNALHVKRFLSRVSLFQPCGAFFIQMCYFAIVFHVHLSWTDIHDLYTCIAHLLQHFTHKHHVFILLCQIVKEFQLLRAAPLINVSFNPVDQSEVLAGGQELWASVRSFIYC